jgi:hypothetical protein
MQNVSLNKLDDFIQVAYSVRNTTPKLSIFSKHILFITIYLMLH